MNRIITAVALVLLISCNKEPQNYLSISGKVTGSDATVLTIQNDSYSKEITLNEDGTFSDTLHLKDTNLQASYEESFYGISAGQVRSFSFLQNGYEIELNIDGNEISYAGKGAENSNYIKEKIALSQEFMNIQAYFSLEQEAFDKKLDAAKKAFDGVLNKYKNSLNADFAAAEEKSNADFYKILAENYTKQSAIASATKKGSPSPKFVNYENYKGGTTSLDDLKGKFVYIDVWATWCGPCKREIPYLQTLEKKFHGKNIEFVSISVDKPQQHEAWKNMIADKNMSGIQLFAGDDQSFQQAYQISGIPRFILLDPKGNIVNANAPRPSDPSLESVFTELGI